MAGTLRASQSDGSIADTAQVNDVWTAGGIIRNCDGPGQRSRRTWDKGDVERTSGVHGETGSAVVVLAEIGAMGDSGKIERGGTVIGERYRLGWAGRTPSLSAEAQRVGGEDGMSAGVHGEASGDHFGSRGNGDRLRARGGSGGDGERGAELRGGRG